MFNVSQVRPLLAPFVQESGKCRESAYVLAYINECRQLLLRQGNYTGTVETVRIQAHRNILTLPNRYVKMLAAQACNRPLSPNESWYEHDSATISRGIADLDDRGDRFVSFRDYYVDKKPHDHRIVIMGEDKSDKGKDVTITGIDENGRRISVTRKLGGDYERMYGDEYFRQLIGAQKEVTTGAVRVFIHDPNRDVLDECSIFEPLDTAIRMRRYGVACGGSNGVYLAKMKRRYIPLVNETDEVEFPTDAMIQACIAVTARRKGDSQGYVAGIQLAIKELELEKKDDKSDAPFIIRYDPTKRLDNL